MPLEQRCVRFIDNFSSGQRGAASTEYADKSRTHLLFTALLAHAVMELVRSSFGSMEIGSMQVFSQGRLPCHLHPLPVSPPNQTIFVQYSWGGTELAACSKLFLFSSECPNKTSCE